MAKLTEPSKTTWADVAQNTVNCLCILGLCGMLTYCVLQVRIADAGRAALQDGQAE